MHESTLAEDKNNAPTNNDKSGEHIRTAGCYLSKLIIRLEVVMVQKPWYVKKPIETSNKPSSVKRIGKQPALIFDSPRAIPPGQIDPSE
jgi:hypothetical protein